LNIRERYRSNIDYCMSQYVQRWKGIAAEFRLPLITYEGGQQMDTNAGAWSADPGIYGEYRYFLDQLQAKGVELFCHYTLYGAYSNGANSGAWGLISAPQANPAATYPKFRATQDWLGSR
jgi:hypothetical protein